MRSSPMVSSAHVVSSGGTRASCASTPSWLRYFQVKNRRVGGSIAICAMISASSGSVHAQIWDRLTNPRSDIVVTHPPQVVLRGVTKISVLEFTGTGRCGPELTERVAAELGRSSQFEVIDRSSIDAVLREQGFQASGAVSSDAAVRLGALLGPAAIFTGRVVRCHVEQSGLLYSDRTDRKSGITVRTYIRRTSAQVFVRINLIDLTTGKVIAGPLIERSDTLIHTSQQGAPEAPSPEEVLTRVYQQVVGDVSRMIYPWSETIRVVLYDDNKCDLSTSAAQIKSGDFAGAAELLQASVANECGNPNDKSLLSKAYYNLGIALTYSDRPDEGLRALQQSSGLRRTGVTNEAIAAVQRLISLKALSQQREANAVELGAPSAAPSSNSQRALLTNSEVIDLVRAKMSDAVIVNQIRNSPCRFDTSTQSLIALKQAGASDAIILEMTSAAATKCR